MLLARYLVSRQVEELDERLGDLKVADLERGANVVDLARQALVQHDVERVRHVLDIHKVARVRAVAVDAAAECDQHQQ